LEVAVEVYTKLVASVELTLPVLGLWLKCGTAILAYLVGESVKLALPKLS